MKVINQIRIVHFECLKRIGKWKATGNTLLAISRQLTDGRIDGDGCLGAGRLLIDSDHGLLLSGTPGLRLGPIGRGAAAVDLVLGGTGVALDRVATYIGSTRRTIHTAGLGGRVGAVLGPLAYHQFLGQAAAGSRGDSVGRGGDPGTGAVDLVLAGTGLALGVAVHIGVGTTRRTDRKSVV